MHTYQKMLYFCSLIPNGMFVRGVAQLASALAWGARGRKFESFHPDKRKKEMLESISFFILFQPHTSDRRQR